MADTPLPADLAARGFIERSHPEGTCHACGGPNVVWFAPSEVWNSVVGDSGGILCPTCFIAAARLAGLDVPWRVAPERDTDMTESAMTLYGDALRSLASLRYDLTEAARERDEAHSDNGALREIMADITAQRDDAEADAGALAGALRFTIERMVRCPTCGGLPSDDGHNPGCIIGAALAAHAAPARP